MWHLQIAAPAVDGGVLELITQDAQFVVEGQDFRVAVNRQTGAIDSYRAGDRDLLAAPLVPNFWKVPNDNQYRSSYIRDVRPLARRGRRIARSKRSRPRSPTAASPFRPTMTLPVGDAAYTANYTIHAMVSIDCNLSISTREFPRSRSCPSSV